MRWMGDIEKLDTRLAALSQEEGALRLCLGQLLEVLGRGAVFELGFSSLGAYGVERCERSVRWVEGARCLARRVEALPELRRAMAAGRVSWTMGELVARVATPVDEVRWLEWAESCTVRQMRQKVEEAVAAARATAEAKAARAPGLGQAVGLQHTPGGELGESAQDEVGDLRAMTCTVDREDAWLFEATRRLLEQLGERGAAEQCEALLAEAQATLLALLPQGAIDVGSLQGVDVAQRSWVEQLRRWRAEAEVACEQNLVGNGAAARVGSVEKSPVARAAALGIAPLEHLSGVELDHRVRALASALARHELVFSQLVLRFHRADGWRRLGYATETQYARERLGLSRSCLAARRALALRVQRLPRVAAALRASRIGVEAALQLVRVATVKTEAAWVERAQRRTIKHLREEVAAALVAVRVSGNSDCSPPEDGEMAAFQALEQAVVSGRFVQSPGDVAASGAVDAAAPVGGGRPLVEPASESVSAWCVMLGSLGSWLASGLQMAAAAPRRPTSRAGSGVGRVALRLRMSCDTFAWWRGLEAQARRWLPCGMSWLRFLCSSLWQGWRHLLGTDVAYSHIYVRDCFRCTSPVCTRRDVTPHHIRFRSAGGSDEAYNLTSPCSWCHLRGVHGGRIRACGTAEHLCWELGPRNAPTLVVHGRERLVA